MHILVLGGYGLIGLEICRDLQRSNYDVTGLARSKAMGERLLPTINWIGQDISKCLTPEDWTPHLNAVDVVINASGALQKGLKDDINKVQNQSIVALIQACQISKVKQFIQISAPNATSKSSTEFYRSKAAADTYLKASSLSWVVFRPGLVIARQAYGGTKLIRLLSAFPYVQPIALADSPIKTVSVSDVARAVRIAIERKLSRVDYDLMEDHSHSLKDIVLSYRRWMGFKPPIKLINTPPFFTWLISKTADGLSWLGWRSPLRSTAMKVLVDGVDGDSETWSADTGHDIKNFEQILSTLRATTQDRISAKTDLIYPVLIAMFAIFWTASGLIGFWQYEAAVNVLPQTLNPNIALSFVLGGSLIDILIGFGLLFRPWIKRAAFAAIVTSLAYMLGGMVFTPNLWADPLGPFVKIIPVIATALTIIALTTER